ncbi:sugar phosphate nucleotidyltransferase [Photobacterium aphoticum]|uniref:Mannose-1-phosphate guanyltransferase n=1 Tax=Photobacterium aphoticum TaxID=754436 RepID=A0A0J1GTX9_9GAMM|nr:NDP-sugar synthase [Photobacterium aphoticum]KLV03126.1 mannose-1-phosphate guanyltransferase [Photobacterium aphoticum]PSU56536.1 mannose-1-phosphate guanyltransferase [Photobacterium aphoticum]GHA51935.1 mannose-1-phosphate guanylyltransferase [Photobacterium aphoticum]
MKGMILAAGKGTRVRPITHTIPKPMIPILGKPVMESMIQLFSAHGIKKIVVNTSHLAEVIENYFSDGHHFNVQLSYSYEGEMVDGKFVSKALGSAGGMRKIQDFSGFFDETFVVVCGDAWIDLDLTEAMNRHKEKGGIATIVTRDVPPEEVCKYGVVVADKTGKVTSFQEKPAIEDALSTEINTGIYIFEPAIFDYIPADQEYDIGSELFPKLVEEQVAFYATSMDFQWLDVGNISDIWGVTSEILHGKVPGYPIPGTQVKPGIWVGINTVFDEYVCQITPPVIISSGCEIQPGVKIEGPAVIGANCKVETGAEIKQSLISDYIHVAGAAYVDNKTVFGDYFISHDGYTQSLSELDAVHMLKDRRQTQPMVGSIGSIPTYVPSDPASTEEDILNQ